MGDTMGDSARFAFVLAMGVWFVFFVASWFFLLLVPQNPTDAILVLSRPKGLDDVPWPIMREFIQRKGAGQKVKIVRVTLPNGDPEFQIMEYCDAELLGRLHSGVHDNDAGNLRRPHLPRLEALK